MGLYAAYAFNEGSGSSIIDYSGNNRNMTVSGTNSWVAGHGSYTYAFAPGASSSGAQWNNGTTIAALAGDVTLMMWYQHTTTADTASHVGGLYGGPGTARLSAWSYRSLSGVTASPENTVRDSAGSILSIGVNGSHTDTSWHHVATVYHSTGLIEQYLDGTLVTSSSPTSNPIGQTTAIIGVGSVLGGSFAEATVQDMRVFDSALTAQNVSSYMSTPVVSVPPNLMMTAFP